MRCVTSVTRGGAPPASAPSSWSSSGEGRWPPIEYACTVSETSAKWTPSDGERPAPDTPVLLSTTTSAPARPAATAGANPRRGGGAGQPGAGDRRRGGGAGPAHPGGPSPASPRRGGAGWLWRGQL